jgi:hypothetical protein
MQSFIDWLIHSFFHIHVCTQVQYINQHLDTSMYVGVCVCVCVCVYIHTYIYKSIQTYTTYIYAYIHIQVYTYVRHRNRQNLLWELEAKASLKELDTVYYIIKKLRCELKWSGSRYHQITDFLKDSIRQTRPKFPGLAWRLSDSQ